MNGWEQSGVLAKKLSKKLLPIVEQYLEGEVGGFQLQSTISHVLATIPHDTYKPLFETSFIINWPQYLKVLSTCLNHKCIRLKKIVQNECKLGRDTVAQQIETAVQAAFYTHIRWLYNTYAIKNNYEH